MRACTLQPVLVSASAHGMQWEHLCTCTLSMTKQHAQRRVQTKVSDIRELPFLFVLVLWAQAMLSTDEDFQDFTVATSWER